MLISKNRLYIFIATSLIWLCACLTGCIEDGYTSSPSDQPIFSVDTLKMGTVYTEQLTTTHRFIVYNPHNKGLNIADINVSGDNADLFRLNVDGISGKSFRDTEIRANDSIFVFVAASLPPNGQDQPQRVEASINFTVNGVASSVIVTVDGQDIHRLQGTVISTRTVFQPGKPYQIKDSLVVDDGAILTLKPGTVLRFHDGARMVVRGSLRSAGTPEAPVLITGDRTGNVITDVSFDLMSRQWGGIEFAEQSSGNILQYTEISNSSWGVVVYGYANVPQGTPGADGSGAGLQPDDTFHPRRLPPVGAVPSADVTAASGANTYQLSLRNCRLRNSGEFVLAAVNSSVEALGCEFAEAAQGLIYIAGGNHRFDQCTVSNHYLFSVISGAAWTFPKVSETEGYYPTHATITNTITYGIGSDVAPGDLTGYEVYFNRCLFKSPGTDDDNFIDTIWESDPLFYTDRSAYLFDYRLRPDSPAIGAAYTSLSDNLLDTDYYGLPRNADLGAYVYDPTLTDQSE